MKIVFVSVVLNNHQVGVADRLYEITQEDFQFIQTGQWQELDRKGGDDFSTRPYLVRASDFKDKRYIRQLIEDADVMIYGAAPIEYLRHRVKTGKLTFLYSERWLKRGWVNIFSPRLLRQQLFYHLHCHGKPMYALCASSFAAGDFRKLYSFRNKCFKWGYFPKIPVIGFDNITKNNRLDEKIKILWVARFIPLKHPEIMIGLAKYLEEKSYDYSITMIGDGELRGRIEPEAKALNVNITFEGALSNKDVLHAMQHHQIFCFTSNRLEGWGAVVNEAMANGCCPVVSDVVGSAKFLIKDGENGYTYNTYKSEEFYEKVCRLIENKEELLAMRKRAYETIHEQWNAETAADNLYRLSMSLLNGQTPEIEVGPGSKA